MVLAVNLVGCSEQSAPTEAHRMAASESPLMAAAAEHAGAIVGHDSCDPESFNEAIGDPNTCVKPGHTTFQEFIAELQATKVARDWRFNPLEATARRGEALLAVNVGGEVHTFTPVKKFGGGFIDILNGLSGNPVPAPECLNIPGLDFVASGDRSLIPGAALAAVADANGIARVECCLHPWMRSEVRIR
jgi:hypothetical protein